MDVKDQVMEAVKKISSDKALQEKFMKDPAGAVETALGVKVPKEVSDKIIDAVKAKIAGDKVGEGIDLVKGLLGK